MFNLPANISFRAVEPNFRNPMVNKWNATLQRDLGGNMALEASYIGSHGAKQVHNWDSNTPRNDPRPGIEANPRRAQPFLRGGIQETSSFGVRTTMAGGKARKALLRGLDYTASYTWGHALADTGTPLSGSLGFGLRDVTCYSCEYSDAAWDVRHRFVYSAVYDIPFGRGKAASSENKVNQRRARKLAGEWDFDVVYRPALHSPNS